MRLVVADASPIFYLLSVGQIEVLPQLFGKVFLPDAVHQELCHLAAPTVRSRTAEPALEQEPSWNTQTGILKLQTDSRQERVSHSSLELQ
jgi:hypothetical protein